MRLGIAWSSPGIEGRGIRIHHEALLSLTRVGCALYVLAM